MEGNNLRNVPISLIAVSKNAADCGDIASVRRILDKNGHFTGVFELTSGTRLLKNAEDAGEGELLCRVTDCRLSDEQGIICELLRKRDGMFVQAEKIALLKNEHGMTEEKIARSIGCSQSYVANKLRLLNFSADERAEITRAELTERHARTLLRIKDAASRAEAIQNVCRRRMNVAQTEEYVDEIIRKTNGGAGIGKISKFLLADIKPFFNTLNRATEILQKAGVRATTSTKETDTETIITVRILKY